MGDLNLNRSDFSREILEHCLDISRGECSISEQLIMNNSCEMESQILYGLRCMYEELQANTSDIEARLKIEMESKLLKEKNKDLEQFAYKASHDLKEPMRSIFNFSQLLKSNLPAEIDPKLVSYLDYIEVSAKRMTDMIAHLLEYARFGNKLEFSKIDTQSLVQGVHFDLIHLFQKTNGKLIVGDLYWVVGDQTLLRLLIQNLISNGLKFCKPDVKPIVTINSERNSDYIKFTIKDNGIGISDQDKNDLFNIFSRGNHKDDSFEGSGIGLAHCKKIVEFHQGEIWCESNEDGGTNFCFTISNKLQDEIEG